MFNFTKKHSNVQLDASDQAAGVGKKYDAAIKKIERLENELNQKTQELNQSCKAQFIMSEGVKNCVSSLCTVQNQLYAVAAHLDRSNKHIFTLMQENKALKSSGDEWFKRAIKLEFDVLMTKDGLKKIEHERDLAIKTCELLQVELMLVDKENNPSRNQD
jgi:small-conductance mechanosensitive channel